jgi:hypothetical protein
MAERNKTGSDQVFVRGRSSRSNMSGRIEQFKTENFDDG